MIALTYHPSGRAFMLTIWRCICLGIGMARRVGPPFPPSEPMETHPIFRRLLLMPSRFGHSFNKCSFCCPQQKSLAKPARVDLGVVSAFGPRWCLGRDGGGLA